MAALYRLLWKNTLHPPKDPNVSFTGKTVIVTGSNVGLGYEAALKYVQKNASKVILGVRSLDKGDAAKKSIEASTGKTGIVEVWQLDMTSYDSIKSFAERAGKLEKLDVAVLNAGVYSVKYEQSPKGWEMDLQVNTLSTTLLALLLLPKLRASKVEGSTPVLEIVASGRYLAVAVSDAEASSENLVEYFNAPSTFKENRQYAVSKLFVMFAAREIAKLAGSPDDPEVVVTYVCPGACKSDLGRGHMGNWFVRVLFKAVMSLILRSTEQGSRTLVSGTSQGKRVHGEFWKDDEVTECRGLVAGDKGKQLQEQIWHEIVDALRKDVPEVLDHVKARL